MQSYIIEELLKLVDIQRLQSLVVDIGASDGHYTSNSYDLIADHGWHGILFEPQEDQLEKARQRHIDRIDRVAFKAHAVSDRQGVISLYGHPNDGDGLTTLNHGATILPMQNAAAHRPISSIDYNTFLAILDLSQVGVLSIDTEGFDGFILQGLFAATTKRPEIIITEQYFPRDSRLFLDKVLLLAKDYECVYDGTDQIFVRKDVLAFSRK